MVRSGKMMLFLVTIKCNRACDALDNGRFFLREKCVLESQIDPHPGLLKLSYYKRDK